MSMCLCREVSVSSTHMWASMPVAEISASLPGLHIENAEGWAGLRQPLSFHRALFLLGSKGQRPRDAKPAHLLPFHPYLVRPALTQQRMMSQMAEAGASVFTAFLQAWESETRKPAWRRADLGSKRGCEGGV